MWWLRSHIYRPHSEGMGKVLFSQVNVHGPHLAQRGRYPHSANWGGGGFSPFSQWGKGTPIQPAGGTPMRLTGGPLSSWLGGGKVVPPVRTGWGYPLIGTGWGYTPIRTGWRLPPNQETEQQNEHLLHGGRYVSYVHAGGLSCADICLQNVYYSAFLLLLF